MSFEYYLVTGTYPDGKRFKAIKTYSWIHATSINLHKGSVWGVKFNNGKRELLIRVGW